MKPFEGANVFILGGGVTGLAAGYATGFPVFEAQPTPGGICSSYYIRAGCDGRLCQRPEDGEAYRFELGGGHWIFGGDREATDFIRRLAPVKSYQRRSSVYFARENLYVPYPLQNNLRFLDEDVAARALPEMGQPGGPSAHALGLQDGPETGGFGASRPVRVARTMREWLALHFGPTLGELFFYPFHARYTAGLDRVVMPQDGYKTPLNLEVVREGARGDTEPAGYNVTFVYPEDGLDALVGRMAQTCDIHYGKRVAKIDAGKKKLFFHDGSVLDYDALISTLPLNKVTQMTGLGDGEPDPYTSVLVLNIGAIRGPRCPQDHWLYIPDSESGFHRVGFYSNVEGSFLPQSVREDGSHVSLYVESAYANGEKPPEAAVKLYTRRVIGELRQWGFIGDIEAVDATWIDVAYTWSYPGSPWRERSLQALARREIFQTGRYGRWQFQGIADSLRDGFEATGVWEKQGIHAS